MPKSLPATRIEAAFLGRSDKPCNCFFVGRSQKKRFVKFAAARQLRFFLLNSNIVRDFARTHMVEASDTYTGFLGDFVQDFTGFLVWASECHAEVASRAFDVWDLDIEISIGDVDAAAALGNKGMAMLQPAP